MSEPTLDGMPEPIGHHRQMAADALGIEITKAETYNPTTGKPTLYVRNEAGQFAHPYTGLPLFPSDADLDFLVAYLQDRGYVVLSATQALQQASRPHRTPDHATSVAGAAHVAPRAGSQKAALLAAYCFLPTGLTDEQAARKADLERACYWKRCGELRAGGWIEETGEVREGSAGVPRIVCRATDKGFALYRALRAGS